MNVRDLLPPLIITAVKRSMRSRLTFDDYNSALAVCNNGYQQARLVETVFEKTRRYRDALAAGSPVLTQLPLMRIIIALGLSAASADLNVIDFGGACGAHYFLAAAVFGTRLRLKWHVVETAGMVEKARSLEDGSLKFFDTIDEARNRFERIDLVFSSSALQYVPHPNETLQRLTACGARNLFLTRVGLTVSQQEIITIQRSHLSANGVGKMPEGLRDGIVQYPVTFMRKEKVEEILAHDYEIRLVTEEDKAEYLVNDTSIDLFGYHCVRTTAAAA